MSEYKLINIGRSKVSKTVTAKDRFALLKEVKKHLASSEVELVDDSPGKMIVLVGGFREVGQVHFVGEAK